jgi:hypothetical protein
MTCCMKANTSNYKICLKLFLYHNIARMEVVRNPGSPSRNTMSDICIIWCCARICIIISHKLSTWTSPWTLRLNGSIKCKAYIRSLRSFSYIRYVNSQTFSYLFVSDWGNILDSNTARYSWGIGSEASSGARLWRLKRFVVFVSFSRIVLALNR